MEEEASDPLTSGGRSEQRRSFDSTQQVLRVVIDGECALEVGIGPPAAPKSHGGQAGAPRRLDVIRGVADHDGTAGGRARLLQRRRDDVGIGFGALGIIRRRCTLEQRLPINNARRVNHTPKRPLRWNRSQHPLELLATRDIHLPNNNIHSTRTHGFDPRKHISMWRPPTEKNQMARSFFRHQPFGHSQSKRSKPTSNQNGRGLEPLVLIGLR